MLISYFLMFYLKITVTGLLRLRSRPINFNFKNDINMGRRALTSSCMGYGHKENVYANAYSFLLASI